MLSGDVCIISRTTKFYQFQAAYEQMIAEESALGEENRVEFQLGSEDWQSTGRDAVTVKGSGDAG